MSSPSFNRQFEPRYGDPIRVADGVERVICRNPGPFTFVGTSTFILGERDVVVIDPGPADSDHLSALLVALARRRVSHIAVTHTHSDHSPAAVLLRDALKRRGDPPPRLAAYAPHPGPRKEHDELIADAADRLFRPDLVMRHGDLIKGDAWTLEAVFTPGHCPNHLAFADPERKILFSGDHVMGWSSTVVAPPDGRMTDYLNSLRLLLSRRDALYLPAHGPQIPDPRDHVKRLLNHRLRREARLKDILADGFRSLDDAADALYPDLDAELKFAARLNTQAHLERLNELGDVIPDNPRRPTEKARWKTA